MSAPVANKPRRQTLRRYALLLAQMAAGIGLGLGLARVMRLPEEQIALIGTLITLVTWLAEESFTLPDKETRWGALIHGALRFLALVGFIMALQSLAALNGWEPALRG